jgi:hypothetical protein
MHGPTGPKLKFKYLGESRTNLNAIHEEIRSNHFPGILATNALGIFYLLFWCIKNDRLNK